jgi:paraquat-inducible protein A
MKLKDENELDNFIICYKCYTLHRKVLIEDGTKAICSHCESVLYRYDSRLVNHGLALSITALIFLVLANIFPVVMINILGNESYITISKTFLMLFDNSFFIVGFIVMFMIFIFPFMIIGLYIAIFTLLYFKIGKNLSKDILVLISHIEPWSMLEIFLVSILVSLVKLIGYAQIHIGISFWTLIVYVILDIYITRTIKLSEIWLLRDRVYKL